MSRDLPDWAVGPEEILLARVDWLRGGVDLHVVLAQLFEVAEVLPAG